MKANMNTATMMDWRTFVRHTAGGRIPLELVDGIDGGAAWGDLQVELLESGEVCILARLLYGNSATIGKKFTHDPENPDEAVSQAKAWLISARKPARCQEVDA